MKKEQITFGKFTNDEWTTINGLDSVQHILDRIKKEIKWTGYQLWVQGSILCDVDTHDLDLSIMGPFIPERINQLLEEVVKIGFEEKTFCDVKYIVSNELYDPERDSVKTIQLASYQPKIRFGNQTFNYATQVGALFMTSQRFPMPKMIRNGYNYKTPVRVI